MMSPYSSYTSAHSAMTEDEMIYRIRRTSILADIRAARANGGRVDQLRMELAALRSCRALVS
jgi:hypothetical protein